MTSSNDRPADWDWVAGRLRGRPPAKPSAVRSAERHLGYRLPEDYRDFLLRVANGGEGFVGEDRYLMLWRVEELTPENEIYDVEHAAPGLVLFGSSGGGLFYAFERSGRRVMSLPSMPIDGAHAEPEGASFRDFLRQLAVP